MEHDVKQQSPAWFDLRRQMVVTASRFGDAAGVGQGKTYDFLMSILSDDVSTEGNSYTQHGIVMEPVIHEAYGLLTGHCTRKSGFWTLQHHTNPLEGKVGASPDAVVIDRVSRSPVGLCEFKAPVHRIYRDIPRSYMVQIQGQMAITGLSWCDFMALCNKTREIMLLRVHYCEEYWKCVAERLDEFCKAYQELTSSSYKETQKWVQIIQQRSISEKLPYESQIKVQNLLKTDLKTSDSFCGPSGMTFTFDLLIGAECRSKVNGSKDLMDGSIEDIEIEKAMINLEY